jgi:hypothetical protein
VDVGAGAEVPVTSGQNNHPYLRSMVQLTKNFDEPAPHNEGHRVAAMATVDRDHRYGGVAPVNPQF